MRFLINVDAAWNVTITSPSRTDGWSLTRTMRKVPNGRGGNFPAPPETPLTEPHLRVCPLCAAKDVTMIDDVYRSICDRRPWDDGVDQFGHYLFETLLGEEIWQRIKQAAEEAHEQTIELALSWSAQEHDLRDLWGLHWEMMRSRENFLAAGYEKATVAITRIVADAKRKPRQISLPPRVLFIVGTTLSDPVVKPGAEYLGMLRLLKCGGYSIHSRVVEKATWLDVQAAVKSFKPDVVHFICHGNIDSGGNPYLELVTEDKDERPPTGDQLVQLLRVEGEYPPIVVLSACYSASAGEAGSLQGPHVTAPLAAQLVQGGVPIVIGMAGQVSNFACRLFTRRFGTALVEGEPLVTATALARRATFAESAPPRKSVDWAFPALYLAEDVEPGYVPVKKNQANPAEQVQKWITAYNVEREPVFCGREEFFREYYNFFSKENQVHVLAIEAPQNSSGYGKTRLLQELTIQALRDGHVPCLLSAEQKDWAAPTSVADLGRKLSEVIFNVYETFKLSYPQNGQLDLIWQYPSLDERSKSDLDPSIQTLIRRKGESPTSPRVVSIALQKDLIRLARDVREKEPLIQQTHGRVIVLLDAVELYHQVIADLCDPALGPSALGPNGLGSDEEIVPVVLAYSKPATPTNLQELLEKKSPSWLRRRTLEAFRQNGEDMLAYGSMLLYPFKPAGIADNAMVPLVVNEEANKDRLDGFWTTTRIMLMGIPGIIANGGLYKAAKAGKILQCLIEADDNMFWTKWTSTLEIAKE